MSITTLISSATFCHCQFYIEKFGRTSVFFLRRFDAKPNAAAQKPLVSLSPDDSSSINAGAHFVFLYWIVHNYGNDVLHE